MRRELRRKRIKEKNKKSKSVAIGLWTGLALALLVLSFILIFFKVSNLDKFVFVNKTVDGGGEVVIVDPKADRVLKYKILGDTVLESARGFGEYKLSSLWILGEKEHFDGQLVSESVRSNYLIPVYYWKNGKKTNLPLFERIKVILTNIGNISYEKTLTSRDLQNGILINFLDNDIQEDNITIEVNDLTGDQETINKVSKILGTMGSKISNYTKGYDKDLDCEISGKNINAVKTIANVFGCKISNQNMSETVDITLNLGILFANRF